MSPALRMLVLPALALAACAQPEPDVPSLAAVPARPAGVLPASAAAAVTPTVPMRIRPTLDTPLDLRPLSGDLAPDEPAPVPDRSIEPPRDRFASSLDPRIEPMLLPPERRPGATFGSEHLRETGPDRPLDNLLPGARLRIPFESSNRR
ncbi:MAG TPA: hypothetical protein VGN83_24525 [Falsiroseomonas sp.]|jgi:hypothetical protein|nr:hypothetical protein [Falsiroseomonas sp.]